MARNYISGKINIPEGPIPGVGGLDQLEMADTQNFTFGDNEILYFGSGPDVTVKWDGTDLAIGVVVGSVVITSAHGALSGAAEEHSVDIVSSATLGSGCGLVGLNVAVTPNGGATNLGTWRAALYGKVTMAGGTGGQGYVDVAELELITSNAGGLVPDHCVLALNYSASHTNPGSCAPHAAYIWLRSYGTQVVKGLMAFFEDTRTAVPGSDSTLLSAVGAIAGRSPYDTAIRFFIGSTPYWLMASSVGPASLADLKVMGSATGNYLEWDASADRLNVVVAGRTVTGEEHAVDISHVGTVTSGDSVVGLNVVTTPVGSAASWVAGAFIKAAQASKVVNGYICGLEVELASVAADASDNSILILNSIRNHTGSPPACDPYLTLREYGTTYADVFVRIFGDTGQGAVNAVNAARLVSQAKAAHEADCDVVIRCMVGSTPVWLLASTVAPS